MRLSDRWEELRQEHRLVETVWYETGTTYWANYGSRCSCGEVYPAVQMTFYEAHFLQTHIPRLVRTHRQLQHLKHLVGVLLDQDQAQDQAEGGAAS